MDVIEYQSANKENSKGFYLALGCFAGGVVGMPFAVVVQIFIVVPLLRDYGQNYYLGAFLLLIGIVTAATWALGHFAYCRDKSKCVRWLAFLGSAATVGWIALFIVLPSAGM